MRDRISLNPKLTKRRAELCRVWDEIESVNPGITTEQLFARVSEKTGADAGDVSIALYARFCAKGEDQ